MKLTNKKIGIWGFGVSGQSLARYFIKQNPNAQVGVLEKNLTPELQAPYANYPNVTFYKDEPATRQQFLEHYDSIIPSPGIDLRSYTHYSEKFLAEADLFYLLWNNDPPVWFDTNRYAIHSPRATIKNARPECSEQSILMRRDECIEGYERKKIIGITGTLGKTSITHLLSTLLAQAGISLVTGGNIGTGMFDLLSSDASCALLELSSFQLDQCKHFIADIGVITNIYPNHLDRHETMENYAQAKQNVFLRQQAGQWAVVPLEDAADLRKNPLLATKPMVFFTKKSPPPELFEHLIPGDRIYYCDENNTIIKLEIPAPTLPAHFDSFFKEKIYREIRAEGFTHTTVLQTIPTISYQENWIIITAVLDVLHLNANKIITQAGNLSIPDYRLEKVAIIHGTSYYNDSKSTIMQATLAAVDALKKTDNNTIILLLGGTSKGVDRAPFVKQLKDNVAHVICFGAEATALHGMCEAAKISATAVTTLDDAVAHAHQQTSPPTPHHVTSVVLSPGGASFDLFKDYKERGERFKQLVEALCCK